MMMYVYILLHFYHICKTPNNLKIYGKLPATGETSENRSDLIKGPHLDEVQVEKNILWVPAPRRVELLGEAQPIGSSFGTRWTPTSYKWNYFIINPISKVTTLYSYPLIRPLKRGCHSMYKW